MSHSLSVYSPPKENNSIIIYIDNLALLWKQILRCSQSKGIYYINCYTHTPLLITNTCLYLHSQFITFFIKQQDNKQQQ